MKRLEAASTFLNNVLPDAFTPPVLSITPAAWRIGQEVSADSLKPARHPADGDRLISTCAQADGSAG